MSIPIKGSAKAETRKNTVLHLRQSNPCLTLSKIGEQVGCTRENVRMILKRNGLPTKHWTQNKFTCNNCGKEFVYSQRGGGYFSRIFCSKECKIAHYRIPLYCSSCGKLFYRIPSQCLQYPKRIAGGEKFKYQFCSKKCNGKWLYTNYGNQYTPPKLNSEGQTK